MEQLRFVFEAPNSGFYESKQLFLPVRKGYAAVLRRITYSLDVSFCERAVLDAAPSITLAVQKPGMGYVSGEGVDGYIGGIVIQPIQSYHIDGTAFNMHTIPMWGTRAFLALEQRYIVQGDELATTSYNYQPGVIMGLRIEYSTERLSELEFAQAIFR